MAKRNTKETNARLGCRPIAQLSDAELADGLDVVRSDIDKLQCKLCSISEHVKQQSNADVACQHRRCELTEKLEELRSDIDHLMNTKAHFQRQKDMLAVREKDKKDELAQLKLSIGYSRESEIQNRKRTIESLMSYSTISLRREKLLMKELAELNKKAVLVRNVEAKYPESQDIAVRIKRVNLELTEALTQRHAYREEIEELKAKRAGIASDVQEMFDKRDACNASVQAKVKQLNAMVAEQGKRKNMQADGVPEESCPPREVRQIDARQQQSENQYCHAHSAEIALIESCMEVCAELESAESKKCVKSKTFDVPGGVPENYTVLKSKEERANELSIAPTKVRRKKGSKANGGIKHTAQTRQVFERLNLEVPATISDIAVVVQKLRTKLDLCQRSAGEQVCAMPPAPNGANQDAKKAEEARAT